MQKRKKQSEKTEYLFKGDSCLYILVVYYTLYDVLPLLLLPFVSLFVCFFSLFFYHGVHAQGYVGFILKITPGSCGSHVHGFTDS